MKEQKAILRMIIKLPFLLVWVWNGWEIVTHDLVVWYATDPVPDKKDTFETWIYTCNILY